jgi:hypothetical protein
MVAPKFVEAGVRRYGTNILGFWGYVASLRVIKGGGVRTVDIDSRAQVYRQADGVIRTVLCGIA